MENSIQSYGRRLAFLCSLDHLVCSHQHIRRNRYANLLRCFQIDHQLEFRRLLDGKIRRLSAF